MPFDKLSEEELGKIAKFALIESQSGEPDVRIASWRAFKLLTAYQPDHPCCAEIGVCVRAAQVEDNITMTFLKYRVLSNLGEDTAREQELLYDRDVVSDIFLDNLKTATPWVIKSANIKLLVDQIAHGKQEHMLHIAAHLSNLVKVSEHVIVRHDAGTALLRIIGLLTPDQRNEIVVELMKGLEVGEYEFSKYIPQYLGQAALWLPPEQLEEIVSYLHGMMANANDQIVSVALDTVGVLLDGIRATQSVLRRKKRYARNGADVCLASCSAVWRIIASRCARRRCWCWGRPSSAHPGWSAGRKKSCSPCPSARCCSYSMKIREMS